MLFLLSRLNFFVFLFSVIIVTGATDNNNYKTVHTEYGPIRGQKLTSLFYEKPYYSFKGIPFVEPPVGDLRFKVFFPNSIICSIKFL